VDREQISRLVSESFNPQFERVPDFAQQASSVHMWSTTAIVADELWAECKAAQLGIGGEVNRECCPLRVAQPSGIVWDGSFYSLRFMAKSGVTLLALIQKVSTF